MEPLAWALRHVTSVTAAPPSRKAARNANVDRDMTAGTVQNQVRMLSAVASTTTPAKGEMGARILVTLSTGASAGVRTERRAKHPRDDTLVRLAAGAGRLRKGSPSYHSPPTAGFGGRANGVRSTLGDRPHPQAVAAAAPIARDDQRRRKSHQSHATREAQRQALAADR